MKFNMSEIMKKAWSLFRKDMKISTFGEALHRAWLCAKQEEENFNRIRAAKANVAEETRTWYGWKMEGREVIHESKCLFQVKVLDGARGDGATRILSYFGYSQTREVAEAV